MKNNKKIRMDIAAILVKIGTPSIEPLKEMQEESWEESIMRCIQGLEEFSLQDVYGHKEELAKLHPKNRTIEATIRRQLQFLRDRGVIEFLGKGRYRVKTPESDRYKRK